MSRQAWEGVQKFKFVLNVFYGKPKLGIQDYQDLLLNAQVALGVHSKDFCELSFSAV